MDDPRFDTFWRIYPRRVSKQDARKAWQQVGVDDEVFQLILAALKWQLPEWDNLKFVPYPATWLRGRRWEDENPNAVQRRSGPISISAILAELNRQK